MSGSKVKLHWQMFELKFLIDVLLEMNITQKMDGKKFRTQELFKKVQQKLAEKDVHRSVEQIISKYKHLKAEYSAIKNNNNKSGRATKTMVFADKISQLFSGRPRETFPIAHGIDSEEYEDEQEPDITEEIERSEKERSPHVELAAEIENKEPLNETINTPNARDLRGRGGRVTYSRALQEFWDNFLKGQDKLQTKFLAEQKKNQERWMAFEREESQKDRELLRQLLMHEDHTNAPRVNHLVAPIPNYVIEYPPNYSDEPLDKDDEEILGYDKDYQDDYVE